ncbi:MAG: hypothetical protein AB7H97_09980 [Pseudobdellovibrionaceae bacterium]
MKSILSTLILICLSSFANANTCDVNSLVSPFKAGLEKNYFDGKIVSFRLLLNGPDLRSGKYFFIADDGKWSGPVKVDLQTCKMETDGNWVMWRTIDEVGNY